MGTHVRTELAADEIDDLLALYQTYPWWADRTTERLRRAVEHTDELVVLADDETADLVAAARVLTDYAFYATVYDVVVHEHWRGEGLGARLMDTVVAHPDLQSAKRLSLFSREGLVPFYESCGFERSPMVAPIPERDGDEAELVRMTYEFT